MVVSAYHPVREARADTAVAVEDDDHARAGEEFVVRTDVVGLHDRSADGSRAVNGRMLHRTGSA